MSQALIKPQLKDDALLADIDAARSQPEKLHLWWLGQSGFLVQFAGKHLLFDPYLSDSLSEKYANTDKPHVRMTELVIDPSRLDFLDVVTSSHNHTDHLDGPTLTALLQANTDLSLVVPAANQAFAADRLHVPPDRLIPINDKATIGLQGFEISAVPAAHEQLDYDDRGQLTHLGFVVKVGLWSIYHSGDTVVYEGMVDRLKAHNVNVALLPINGRAPERRVSGNLWGREAAQLAKDIAADVVIPCHYDMFTFNTATTDEFVTSCKSLNQPYTVLQNGGRWSSP